MRKYTVIGLSNQFSPILALKEPSSSLSPNQEQLDCSEERAM